MNKFKELNETRVSFGEKNDFVFMTLATKTTRNEVPGSIRVIKNKEARKFFATDNPVFEFDDDMAQDVLALDRGESMDISAHEGYMVTRL